DIPRRLTRCVYGVRLYAPNLRHVDLFSPGSFFLTTDTAWLLRWLAHEAQRAGARLICGARFTRAQRHRNPLPLPGVNATTRYILGADGARSAVARCFGLGRNSHFLVGVEAEFETLDAVDPRFLHCFLDSDVAPGYLGWAVPGSRVTQVGLAMSATR